MRRLAEICLIFTIVVGAFPSSLVTQASAAQTGASDLDLAVMTLTPSDIASLGLPRFGLANQSSQRDAESDALVQADGDELEAARRLAVYQENGFRSRYVGSLLRPQVPLEPLSSGLVAARTRITTAVTEFDTAEGAAATFAFNEGEMDDVPGEDVPGTRTFGDESELTRSTGTEVVTGKPLQRIELAFRLGNLIAEAIIVDYRNNEPDITTIEQLGQALLTKIQRSQNESGPALSQRALRLTPMAPWIEAARLRDFYTRFAGTTQPTFPQMVSAIRAGDPFWGGTPTVGTGNTEPLDTYMFWTPVGDGDPLQLPLYVVRLNRYASSEDAAAAISGLSTDLGEGYVDVVESEVGGGIGDQSREFSYVYEGDPTGIVQGHLVVAQVGDIIIRTQVDSPDGVASAGVRALATVQAVCILQQTSCTPMPALDALTALVTGV